MRTKIRTLRAVAMTLPIAIVAVGAVAAPVAAAAPDLVEGARLEAPIVRGPIMGTVARLDVPKGTWIAWATLSVRTPTGTDPTVRCSLRTVDATDPDSHLVSTTRWPSLFPALPVTSDLDAVAAGTFNRGGAFALACRSSLGGVTAQRIRIVAMRRSSVQHLDMAGRGVPAVSPDAPAALAEDARSQAIPRDTWTAVGAVRLPAGRWWLHASLTHATPDDTDFPEWMDRLDCDLVANGERAGSSSVILERGSRMLAMDMVARIRAEGPKTVAVHCLGLTDDSHARAIRVSAVKLGRPVRDDIRRGLTVDAGSGDPIGIHARRASSPVVPGQPVGSWTTVVAVPVPAGNWLAKATFTSKQGSSPDDRLSCVLDGGREQDRTYSDWASLWPLHAMTTIVRAAEPTTVPLRCRMPFGSTSTRIVNLRISLIEAGTVLSDDL